MTDVRKIHTSLLPRAQSNTAATAPRNQYKNPESDKVVNYNSNGFLEIDNGVVYCPRNIVVAPDEQTARTYSYESILRGAYLDTNVNPLHSSVITPYRSFLIFSGGANSAWTFPDLVVLLNYMRDAFPGMLIGGLSWTFTVVNSSASVLTLTVPPPATTGGVGRLGFNNGNSHDLAANTAARITVVVTSTTPGSENVVYVAH